MSRTFRHPRPIHQTIYHTKFHSRPRHWQFFLLFAFRAPVFLFPFVGVGPFLFWFVFVCFFLGSFSFVPFLKKQSTLSAIIGIFGSGILAVTAARCKSSWCRSRLQALQYVHQVSVIDQGLDAFSRLRGRWDKTDQISHRVS